MPSTTIPATVNKTRHHWSVLVSKKLVLAQLKNIKVGCLIIKQHGQSYHFGQRLQDSHSLYAELHIHEPRCYVDILTGGSIGAAEAYMSGDWSSPDLTRLVQLMVTNMDVLDSIEGGVARFSRPVLKLMHRLRANTERGSKRNIAAHYDLGNEFFSLFLDPTMMYSAGIFADKQATMEQASLHKLDVICQKLQLVEDDHLLEIGTGWGALAIYAAQHYGCRVTTTTISENQYQLTRKKIADAGLENRITLLKQDYRQLTGQFDKLVSVEMVEAVGWKYFEQFFGQCSSLLKADGLMLIQSITIADQRYQQAKRNVDFIQKYIFPGGFLPSVQALLGSVSAATDMRLLAQQDYAEHYAQTLKCWADNFYLHRDQIKALGYNDEFMRMWEYYLCYCEGGFKQRVIGVSHLLLAKPECRLDNIR
ncbi:class I SAM-dependent methyltransferase [Neptunicella sp. SCSIO 80796]|uniref:class I SAM-dependent methyltransferase n=1 Tax=Neptunicella plasticusilytica TaxID=3117012 RepID=UPI003A4E1AF7